MVFVEFFCECCYRIQLSPSSFPPPWMSLKPGYLVSRVMLFRTYSFRIDFRSNGWHSVHWHSYSSVSQKIVRRPLLVHVGPQLSALYCICSATTRRFMFYNKYIFRFPFSDQIFCVELYYFFAHWLGGIVQNTFLSGAFRRDFLTALTLSRALMLNS